MKMTIDEMIKEFNLCKTVRNGEVGICVSGKPTVKQIEMLKSAKPEILAELDRRAAEAEEQEKQKQQKELQEFLVKEKVSHSTGYGFFTPKLKRFSKKAQNIVDKKLEGTGIVTDWGDYSITTEYNITGAELIEMLEAAEKEIAEKEAAEKTRKDEELQKLFVQSKDTGEKVEIGRYTTGCNDPDEECDMDIVVTYAMPDGSTKTVRNHTW